MFYHCVHFWLRDGVSDEEKQSVIEGVRALSQSPNMKSARVAIPAGTDREVVDNSYDIQLLAIFDNKESHDRYQSADDEVHQNFIANFKSYWTKVVIYDSIEV